MSFSPDDVCLALTIKKPEERLLFVLLRLVREGKIKPVEKQLEEGTKILSFRGIREIAHKRGYQVGEGCLAKFEEEVRLLLDVAISGAKLNKRKTLKPTEVTGESLSFKLRKE